MRAMHAHTPATAAAPGFTHVRGPLACDAVLALASVPPHAGTITVQVDLGTGKPYEARLAVGHEPARLVAARQLVRAMRRGTLVDVYASGGTRDKRTKQAALAALQGVTSILLAHMPSRHEPAHKEPAHHE